MLLGKVIAERRKSLGLSQSDLATDICTQATISKIEAKNIEPMLNILVKICLKLNLTLNEVFSEFSDLTEQTLNEVDRLVDIYKLAEAQQELDKLQADAVPAELKNRYFFTKGNLALIYQGDYENALFYLNVVLQATELTPATRTLAFNGLGIIYFEKKEDDKARYYFEQALATVWQVETDNISGTRAILKVLNNVSKFYSKIGEYQKSNEITQKAIHFYGQSTNLASIEQFYFRIAANLLASLQPYHKKAPEALAARDYLRKAQFLAQLTDNQVVLQHIDELAAKYGLKLEC